MMKRLLILFALAAALTSAAQPLRPLPLREIETRGWIRNQMLRDITSGYISVYDRLQPTMQGNVFGPVKAKNYSIDSAGNWVTRRETWWPGEHEGYFADLVVRNAFLTRHEPWIARARQILDRVLAAQEKSGYIGIYDEECRLDNLLNENGEFWTQSRMLGALLAMYEYSGERKYFDAAKRAADYTIERYVSSGKSYFHQPAPNGGGLTHGLMFCETLEWLHRLTGDRKYVDFARWLYEDYSSAEPRLKNVDCQLDNLLIREKRFAEHSVHVCEHMRVVFWLAQITGDPALKTAAENILHKYRLSAGPTGILVMDPLIHESVAENFGSGYLPYEYCSITESVISFASAMQKFPDAALGDRIENLTFNAGQGARLPDGKAISYATTDNRLQAVEDDGFRNQVAACHSVVCCNLNAAKLMPYYTSNMWMKSADGETLYALLLGPSAVDTRLSGIDVKIEEQTVYPFENELTFIVEPERPCTFTLVVREPAWSAQSDVEVPGAEISRRGGFLNIRKRWTTGDRIRVRFDAPVRIERFHDNENYVRRGALVYALRFDERMIATRSFEEKGLANYDVFPADEASRRFFATARIEGNPTTIQARNPGYFRYEANPAADAEYPFDKPYGFIRGRLVGPDQRTVPVTFVPLGSTLLRKVTFREDK